MARKIRVEYEGAIYHVMNRVDRQELIFLDDKDRETFLATLDEACAKTASRTSKSSAALAVCPLSLAPRS
ncbi:MAG: hypothetical protein WCS94_16870 [Verrucomicrobiota bacterium]